MNSNTNSVSEDAINILKQNAKTIQVASPPAPELLVILILEITSDRMYAAHVEGFLQLTAVEHSDVRLNCALHIIFGPELIKTELDNNSGDPPVFQSVTIDEEITCKRVSLQYFGDTSGVNTNLAANLVELDGLDELEVGP